MRRALWTVADFPRVAGKPRAAVCPLYKRKNIIKIDTKINFIFVQTHVRLADGTMRFLERGNRKMYAEWIYQVLYQHIWHVVKCVIHRYQRVGAQFVHEIITQRDIGSAHAANNKFCKDKNTHVLILKRMKKHTQMHIQLCVF